MMDAKQQIKEKIASTKVPVKKTFSTISLDLYDYEPYFKNLVNSFIYSDSFEKKIKDAATLSVFGSEFKIIALSLLLLRPIKCYSMHNIAFNVNTSQSLELPSICH
ncbi:unnamed protein product [Brachionus calyciflorus]|uniref:Uncharacterized protein n=1 Tax=Brachionus calyciflorus TaxID=104777 RepID=A0A814AIC8_9BILA|nr:unnamed protein product [Brachionus calyciflorus]